MACDEELETMRKIATVGKVTTALVQRDWVKSQKPQPVSKWNRTHEFKKRKKEKLKTAIRDQQWLSVSQSRCPLVRQSRHMQLTLLHPSSSRLILIFYILLTMNHVMILGEWPTWHTILFYLFIFIFLTLHVSSTSCSSSGETYCVNTTSGSCHSVSVAVPCAGDSYQRLYWHNFSPLMMSAMCSKHVES